MGRYDKSLALWQRAQGILPCGAQTLSKSPHRLPSAYPKYLVRGQGCKVQDPDGNWFTEWLSALGPTILGYNYPKVTEAVVRQARDGFSFSLDHPLVVEVAEKLVDMVPCAEAVRFLKTGSDAVMAAVRVARQYTGRERVVVFDGHFHGMDEFYQVQYQDESHFRGIPVALRDVLTVCAYGDLDRLEFVLQDGAPVAAVVLEPARTFTPEPGYLQGVKELCRKYGAVCIWDEVVTFGRQKGLTAQAQFGVQPDLCALGKAMGNGVAIAAVVGRKDIMAAFENVFISGTYNGETLGLAAASATLDVLRSEPVVEHIWSIGKRLMDTFNEYAKVVFDLPVRAEGQPCCMKYVWHTGDKQQDHLLEQLLWQEAAKRGLLLKVLQYPNYAHDEQALQDTFSALGNAMGVVGKAWRSSDVGRYLETEGASVGG